MTDSTPKPRPTSAQEGDRWSAYGEHTGIRRIWKDLDPAALRRFKIFTEFKDSFLEDLSPDISVAEWNSGAVLFEEGTYLDLAFFIAEGSVEMVLKKLEDTAPAPIFEADLRPAAAGRGDGTGRSPRGSQETIAYLASADFDLTGGERVVLGEGEFFGEIGALNGWPQSVTATTASVSTLVQIRLPALRKIKRKSKALGRILDETYRSRALDQQLRRTPLLASCERTVVQALAKKVELRSLEPGERLTTEGTPADSVYLVRSGFLKLSQKVDGMDLLVSYTSKGQTVGEVELLMEGVDLWQASVVSVGYSELVCINHEDFRAVVRGHPDVERNLWEFAVDRLKQSGYTRRKPDRSQLTDFALAKGVVQGTSVLVIDLDVCTRCDDCVRGCASTHDGRQRFIREGETFGGFLVARSCYHCRDPVCLIGCPTGAIARVNVGSVVAIDDDLCIGCGTCASNCPYDAIVMHDTETAWSATAQPARLRGEPRLVASKCDLCHASEAGPACVASCPHACAYRVEDVGEFDALLQAKKMQLTSGTKGLTL
ncbi:MAG: cyclic nucleotide-binding domain-containing protein [Gemmatimonadota bacterium]|nr:cyclic nucleotide-binding domain-containing protein [Gemmatimonadota bacterium]